jgi:hypothetical protein
MRLAIGVVPADSQRRFNCQSSNPRIAEKTQPTMMAANNC